MPTGTNVHEFNLGLEKFGDAASDGHRKLVRAVALQAVRGCVLGTRVDTGRMRGNWQTTEGDPAEGFDEARTDKSGGDTIARGSRVAASASGKRPIWLHNGVPYAQYVNNWDKIVETVAHSLRTWLASQSGRL